MRAREVASPSAADLAAAEKDLVIVRRYYVPPAPLPTAKKAADPNPERRASERRSGTAERGQTGRRQQRGPGTAG